MKLRRHAPSVESIEEEAAAFRATATELTAEMEALRGDIADTASDLAAFARQLKEAAGA